MFSVLSVSLLITSSLIFGVTLPLMRKYSQGLEQIKSSSKWKQMVAEFKFLIGRRKGAVAGTQGLCWLTPAFRWGLPLLGWQRFKRTGELKETFLKTALMFDTRMDLTHL
ncbi:putative transmembrane family 234 [Trinorchestia longiramus]|nr:putative transmembrane family 234 [Trinorchestia longiramus]